MLDSMTEYLRLIIKISIILGLVLDLICYKYRNLADAFLYQESLFYICVLLVPTKIYLENSTYLIIAIFHFFVFIMLYTNQGIQLIFHTITLAVINYFIIGYA